MSDQITTAAELDALPEDSVIIHEYTHGVLCAQKVGNRWHTTAGLMESSASITDSGLPFTVLYRPDTPERTEPTEEQVLTILRTHGIECTGLGEVTCVGCRSAGWMTWGEYRLHLARAVLALLPQRVAPSEEQVARSLHALDYPGEPERWEGDGHWTRDDYRQSARLMLSLYASQPTVAEVRALFAEELAAEEDRAAAEELASREVARVRCPQCDLRYEERDQYSCHGHAPHTYREDELREAAEVRVVPTYAGDELRARARAERGEA